MNLQTISNWCYLLKDWAVYPDGIRQYNAFSQGWCCSYGVCGRLGQQMTHVIMKVWYSIISEAARNQHHTSSYGRSNNESGYHNNQQVYEYDICMFQEAYA